MSNSPSSSATATTGLPLFYKQPRPLVAERDADLALGEINDFSYAAGTNSLPVVAAELPMLCKHFPILFTGEETPTLVALLGLRSGENLFVDAAGAWSAGVYMPAYMRRYPFIFMEHAERGEFTLCLDMAAPGVGSGSNRLFENGEPTAFTKAALDFCRDYQAHFIFTSDFIAAVIEADLLVDNRADVTLGDGQKISLGGFKVIDEARFNALPNDTFLKWRERGWLHLVYCHFISSGNWATLIDRTAQRAAA